MQHAAPIYSKRRLLPTTCGPSGCACGGCTVGRQHATTIAPIRPLKAYTRMREPAHNTSNKPVVER